MILSLLPWSRVASFLRPPAVAPSPSGRSVRRLEWAIKAASRGVPGATCLTQAIALSQLLARNGQTSRVQIGVAKEDGSFAAHAWVECSGLPLLSTAAELTRYARFVTWPPPKPHLLG